MKKWGLLLLLCAPIRAEQCQITSPLPVPVLLSGCTYSGSLPSNSTSYIQNTLSPTTTSQAYSVATASVTTNLNVGYLTPSTCMETDSNSNIISAACSSGGGGGSSSLAASFGTARSSPTSDLIGYEPFIGTVSGTTMTITLDPSSVTLQSNFYSFAALEAATGTLTTNLNAIGTATGTIQAQLTSVAAATGTIQTQLTNVAAATGTIQTQLTNIAVATGTIQSQVTLIASATGQIAASTGTIETQVLSIGTATGTIQTQLTSVASATGTIQSQVTLIAGATGQIATSTGSLLTQIYTHTVSPSTGIVAGILNNGIILGNQVSLTTGTVGQVSLSTGTTGILPPTNLTQVSLSSSIVGTLPIANLTVGASNYIINQPTLQSGATAYPQFLYASSASVASLTFSSNPVISGNYTATCQNEVILGSTTIGTLMQASTVTLPASSSCPGHVMSIWKVDGDTNPFTILAHPGDVINGTGTITLYATGQGGTIQADGLGHWFTHGSFYTNPPLTGSVWPALLDTAEPVTASSTTAASPFLNTNPVWVCGYRYRISAGGGAGSPPSQMNLAVYDGNNGNLISSVGPISDVATGIQTAISPPFYLSPNYPYLIAWQPNNTTATINTVTGALPALIGGFSEAAATLTLPNPLSFATVAVGGPLINLITCGGPWTQ